MANHAMLAVGAGAVVLAILAAKSGKIETSNDIAIPATGPIASTDLENYKNQKALEASTTTNLDAPRPMPSTYGKGSVATQVALRNTIRRWAEHADRREARGWSRIAKGVDVVQLGAFEDARGE